MVQQPAMAEIFDFSLGVEAREQAQTLALAVGARDGAFELAARRDGAGDVEHLVAFERQRLPRHAGGKLQRQHAHADEIGPMDWLEALPYPRAHTEEARAFRRPVARRAGAVLRAGDDD